MFSEKILEFIKKYDFSFFFTATIIMVIGTINLYSITSNSSLASLQGLYKTQIAWFFLSLLVGVAISFLEVKNFYRYSYFLYFVNIVLLILVLVLGKTALGAQRWLVIGPIHIQPSEIMKITMVLALARWYAKNKNDLNLGIKNIIIPFIFAFIPFFLIVVQPDLGTGLLILLIFFVITFYRRLRWKSIMIILLVGLLSGTVMYQFGLKEYQRKRIMTFIDPQSDAKGSGYNAIQSGIAIGSGQFLGKGFKKSSQVSLNYLPENHTDFVFSVFNEEHGFFGAMIVIALYVFLFFRFIWLATTVQRIFDSIVAIGLMSIFFWHTIINMGMVTGLLPIVGLPLPLMSYGGSSIMTFMICCGIVTSISNQRNFF